MARIEAKKDVLAGTDIGGRQSIEKSGFANRSETLAQSGAAGESSAVAGAKDKAKKLLEQHIRDTESRYLRVVAGEAE